MSTTIIAKDGDLTVEITEYDYKVIWPSDQPVIRQCQSFLVSREVLKDSSDVLKSMLGGEWREANQSIVTLKDITVPAIEIWFQVLHEVNPNYNVPIPAIWHLANIGQQFRFDILKLKDWFAEWYERQPVDLWYTNYKSIPDPRCLLYPCWVFDHYEGFMRITSFCAYRYAGHIMEINPSRHQDLHLPARVIRMSSASSLSY
ncbi:MAG: hypothetical protein Q9178_006585 [Gyalolechia marmorata]